MKKATKFSKDRVLKAILEAHYSGERCIFEKGELKAALVPIEDLEVLEELEISDNEMASSKS